MAFKKANVTPSFVYSGKEMSGKSPASTFVIETKVAKILGLSSKMLGKCSAY